MHHFNYMHCSAPFCVCCLMMRLSLFIFSSSGSIFINRVELYIKIHFGLKYLQAFNQLYITVKQNLQLQKSCHADMKKSSISAHAITLEARASAAISHPSRFSLRHTLDINITPQYYTIMYLMASSKYFSVARLCERH